MTTSEQDQEFLEDAGLDTLLEQAVDWIAANLKPDDVFDSKTLESWAEANGWVESV